MILVYVLEIIVISQRVLSVSTARNKDDLVDLPPDFCHLPPELDSQGTSKYIQDCESLGRFDIPIPAPFEQQHGIHPVVCCPRNIDEKEPAMYNKEPVYNDAEDSATEVGALDERQNDFGSDYEDNKYDEHTEVLLSNVESNCKKDANSACTPFSRCNLMEELDLNPVTLATSFCSFDEESAELMICCPFKNILETSKLPQKPRFPVNNKPRKCEDQTNLCRRWKTNGACALNKKFVTSEVKPHQNFVTNVDMFQFTMKGCMESCNRCGSKGCVDEFPSCPQWARQGYCTKNSFLMGHSCRESCGSCGYLSTLNTEKQVYKGKSYSRISDPDFDCGSFKSLEYLENIGLDVFKGFDEAPEETNADYKDIVQGVQDNCEESDTVNDASMSNANSNTSIFCSSSIIADKWMITAAHCCDEINRPPDAEIQSQILRTAIQSLTELVEVKNTYIHPRYRYGELHADIALLELGRRVEFKLDEFGDTPICLDKGLDLPGKVAIAQGFGMGDRLLEINVTLMNTDECINQLDTFLQTRQRKKKEFCSTMPLGISDEQICANGIKMEDGITTATCKGDGGGPLFIEDKEGRRNLVGIVSGRLSCCGTAPEWYTSIKYNRDWVSCILDNAPALHFNKAKVEAACESAGIRKGKVKNSICKGKSRVY
ncbi:uncharacterized protein LOC111707120 isoform X2 [Eurytemora carolleeae]|uniref:uncharacterized protein LOC111707120 isoform X2 n=1 Tax=Eurytemora carolleeae TaxID=1294199 RepID=UPI000C75CEE9|nr:uncharacterized protein LOC111707120 isoform X2 [Eurytemora carolleeae]|eukprot:XP_023335892.1 uncharacterized protein LOC111707120 isoform X2 [Eurytemora affinis]